MAPDTCIAQQILVFYIKYDCDCRLESLKCVSVSTVREQVDNDYVQPRTVWQSISMNCWFVYACIVYQFYCLLIFASFMRLIWTSSAKTTSAIFFLWNKIHRRWCVNNVFKCKCVCSFCFTQSLWNHFQSGRKKCWSNTPRIFYVTSVMEVKKKLTRR